MSRPHIVIVGAGFGGIYTAKFLLPYVEKKLIDVTIINKTNYFLFTPLLHEVATGGLRPTTVSESIREIFHGTRVMLYQGEVVSVDTEKKELTTDTCTIPYNYAVIATGATTNYYGIPGANTYALSLKNLRQAVDIREKVINSFEKATLSKNETEKKSLLSFVVVGGGATGVETVAELAEFAGEIQNRYYKKHKACKMSDISITLIDPGTELLRMFDPKIRRDAENRLKSMGVKLLMNTQVTSIDHTLITFSNGKTLTAETIIWTAGVTPTTPSFLAKDPNRVSGRVLTNEFLHMDGEEHVFVLGDSAGVQTPATAVPPPMLAQIAVEEAKVVAHNIVAQTKNEPLKPFVYKPKAYLLSLGRWYAVGEIFGLFMHGRLTWWIWRTIYLFKFPSWNKRFRIAFEWTIDLFYPRDITKVL